MQITRTVQEPIKFNAPKSQSQLTEPDSPPGDSFLARNHDNIVGLAGLAGATGSGVAIGTQLSAGLDGFVGALVGVAAGAVTGAGAGLVAGEAFLRLYPLDENNEKEKYTALARGLAGLTGGLVGAVAGGISGFTGAPSWYVSPGAVLGGAVTAGGDRRSA